MNRFCKACIISFIEHRGAQDHPDHPEENNVNNDDSENDSIIEERYRKAIAASAEEEVLKQLQSEQNENILLICPLCRQLSQHLEQADLRVREQVNDLVSENLK